VRPTAAAYFTAVLAAMSLAGCAVPLGPGFNTERQAHELRLEAGQPPRLRVRSIYRLQNTGDRPLDSLAAVLPDAATAGRRNLRVMLDGRELPAQSPDAALSRRIEIPFRPPWPQKSRHELVIEYDLAPLPPGHAGFAVNEGAAHLRHFGWFPRLRPPHHLFAAGGEAPHKVLLSVRVPEGFRVMAGGNPKGVRREKGEIEHRYEVNDEDDLGPFVVSGRYAETRIKAGDREVLFWTFAPQEPEAARNAAERIAGTYNTYEAAFGALDRRHKQLWIVETPARLAPRGQREADESPAGIAFPEGALLNSRAFALGVASESFLELVDHELAHAWFGQRVAARPEADVLLSEALAEYSSLVAAEARGGEPARRRHAALLLRWYDEQARNVAEKLLVDLRPGDPWEKRAFGYSKGALFFVALEDEFGKEPVRRGLARLVRALSGDEAGLHELRAALEGETGRSLAEFFRAWLNRTGIPEAFRTRYEIKAENGR
jgi:hypothetical protein